jgi:hypothetical protein
MTTSLKSGWLKLLRDYVVAGCDIHGIRCDSELTGNPRRSPFLEILHGFLNRYWGHVGTTPEKIQKAVNLYPYVLQTSGIDLVNYGEKEKELHDKLLVDKTFSYDFFPRKCQDGICDSSSATWRLIGFTYGPSPEDWQIWGSLPTDDFVGDFWYMVEDTDEEMPGAWPS